MRASYRASLSDHSRQRIPDMKTARLSLYLVWALVLGRPVPSSAEKVMVSDPACVLGLFPGIGTIDDWASTVPGPPGWPYFMGLHPPGDRVLYAFQYCARSYDLATSAELNEAQEKIKRLDEAVCGLREAIKLLAKQLNGSQGLPSPSGAADASVQSDHMDQAPQNGSTGAQGDSAAAASAEDGCKP